MTGEAAIRIHEDSIIKESIYGKRVDVYKRQLQHRVMQMIRKNDIRDENGELLNFGTHTFRH